MKRATTYQIEKAATVCITEDELELVLEIYANVNSTPEEVDRLFNLMISDAEASMKRTLTRA